MGTVGLILLKKKTESPRDILNYLKHTIIIKRAGTPCGFPVQWSFPETPSSLSQERCAVLLARCYEQQQGSNRSLAMLLECFIMYKAFLYTLFHLTLTNVGISLTK